MTLHYSDISSYQAGIDLAGESVVAIKVTEGTGYANPQYAAQHAEADKHGVWVIAYHFLLQGSAAAQARYCHDHAGHTPLMIDVEKRQYADGTWSRPTVADTAAFVTEYRKLGGVCFLDYFPHWYWQEIGSPSTKPLAELGMLLVSSNYTTYSDDGPGWDKYGSPALPVAVWQHTDSAKVNNMDNVDRNAFRGSGSGNRDVTLAEFKAAARTGHAPSLIQYSHVTKQDVATLLEWTLKARGKFSTGMTAYLQAGALANPCPFGMVVQTAAP